MARMPSTHEYAGGKLSGIEWITDESRFAQLAPAWEAMLAPDARPFDLHVWYTVWWQAFGGSSKLSVCALWRDGELAAVFPLMRRGRRLGALANLHSSVFRPLARDESAMRELVAAVLETSPASIELLALPKDDPNAAAVEQAVREAGLLTVSDAVHTSPIVETTGEFEDWRAGSKPRWGAPIERFRRKMGRDHEALFEFVEPPQDLEAELSAGFAVEASGWKGRSKTAVLSAPETEQFYRGIARVFHERGGLRLSRIVLDGNVAAFDLCLLWNNRLYLLKTGYDERFSKLAPGLVLRLSTIERCFELGLDAHELLGEDTEWKLKFSTSDRRHVDLRSYRRTPAGAARYLYRSVMRPRLKSAYQSVGSRSRSQPARPAARPS